MYPIGAGNLKMSVMIKGWNFPLLGNCLNLNWEVTMAHPIEEASSIPLLGDLLRLITLITNDLVVKITSPMLYQADNNVLTLLLSLVVGLLQDLADLLLGQNKGLFYYEFAVKFQDNLVYDPDYSSENTILLTFI